MRTFPSLVVVTVLLLAQFSGVQAAEPTAKPKSASKAGAIPPEAKAALEAAGLKVTTGGLSLPAEVDVGKLLRELAKQKKTMMAADREIYAALWELDVIKTQIKELKLQHKNLSAELVNVTDAASNNRIVGALNVIRGNLEQLEEQSTEFTDRLKSSRQNAAGVREEYVQELATVRALADEIPEKWTALAADPEVTDALESLNRALGAKFSLQPGKSFAANIKQLEELEAAVHSEAIKLDNQRNSLWVDVTINVKHKQRMIVDSGATSLSLPDKLAREMGIELTADGTPVRVGLADGRQVPATILKLGSVRVGNFILEDVDCCVLGPEAPDAPPLLGMSFLGQFKFEVDAQQSELKLVKVDSGEPQPSDKGRMKGKSAKRGK